LQPEQPTSLRTFLILWIGQMTSILGSEMTNFAITIWAWQIAGQATPLSLIFFFTYTPKLVAASFAGLLVDRWNRKQLMMGGDTAAGISTIAILLLLLTGRLEIWHFYITAAINGLFGYIQSLAFSASMSAIVPPRHYTRATAMSSYVTYFGSYIMAPANDAAVLASVQFAIGIGGLVGATGLSVWGGPKRRIHGLLFGTALMSLGKIIFGLGRVAWHWMTAGFLAAFVSPAIDSSNQAIWLSKVEPDVQGRVFASRYLIAQVTTPLGLAIAGPLADYFFEPAMMPGGSMAGIFGGLFGTGNGAGMALQYSLFSCCSMLIGFGGYAFPVLRDVESLVPDHHA
jgi:MFS family permease